MACCPAMKIIASWLTPNPFCVSATTGYEACRVAQISQVNTWPCCSGVAPPSTKARIATASVGSNAGMIHGWTGSAFVRVSTAPLLDCGCCEGFVLGLIFA